MQTGSKVCLSMISVACIRFGILLLVATSPGAVVADDAKTIGASIRSNLVSEKLTIQEKQRDENLERKTLASMVQDLKNGMYYFPFVGNNFRRVMSRFLSVYTNLEVTAVVTEFREITGPSLEVIGYTVFFREKK